ncbi:RteC domain-containing protein [Flavobacterium sp. ST-75]|uniref:RteC domain-containing protein n=1 Tax=Flavobacterium rhizophilum TaxID=3163296 RepID=A0ABW8Y963_9FLAO
MVQSAIYRKLLSEVSGREEELSAADLSATAQAGGMISFLQELLLRVKTQVCTSGFSDTFQEIEFFREVKPQILGKLIYYNEVYRIETASPVQGGKLYRKYCCGQLKHLKQNHYSFLDMEFYRYYRSGRTDRDAEYFRRGQLQNSTVRESFFIELDAQFSTYYDHMAARFIAQDLLYAFLLARIDPEDAEQGIPFSGELQWTGTKNALIELIYALYISGAVSHGKAGVRKISGVFQRLFKIPLGDIHHAFHRMKDRAGRRTLFIDHLREVLEEYMDRNL